LEQGFIGAFTGLIPFGMGSKFKETGILKGITENKRIDENTKRIADELNNDKDFNRILGVLSETAYKNVYHNDKYNVEKNGKAKDIFDANFNKVAAYNVFGDLAASHLDLGMYDTLLKKLDAYRDIKDIDVLKQLTGNNDITEETINSTVDRLKIKQKNKRFKKICRYKIF